MKRYKGKLTKQTKELISNNNQRVKELLSLQGLKAASTGDNYTIQESIEKYNKGISPLQIKAWVWYRKNQGIPMHPWKEYFIENDKKSIYDLVKKGCLFVDGQNFVPQPVFTFGNIYLKIAELKKREGFIVENFGVSIYQNHLHILEKSKPKTLSITNPVASERPVILAISKFAEKFTISSLRGSTGVVLESETTLVQAYKNYLYSIDNDNFKGTNPGNIIRYYLEGEAKPRDIDKKEWGGIKKRARDHGELLFKKFLFEAVENTDQLKIDAHYNSNFNAIATFDYRKIPVGIMVSKSFHGFDLEVRAAQREGIAFMELVGSGVIAYDVGVGKTITCIIELACAIENGKCKRPIVCVPNPTYKNWIKEMLGYDDKKGILSGTGIKVNQWYNLGTEYEKVVDLKKAVPERSITLVTYEGFQKLGFSEKENIHRLSELSSILDQRVGQSDRDKEKALEKYRSIIGVGQKGTIADFDILGFDYVAIDEAHNFKNIFSEVKLGDKKDKKRFHVKGGQPSSRGIKAFFICNYVQRKFGRNIMLLTATPFTNSPLEIYSMLSLVAYDYMKKSGIYNIKDFFEQYIQETSEPVVTTSGEIKIKDVVKSFNNRVSLQKLINSHINFKTGEEANIPRPCKVNLPKTSISKQGKIIRLERDKQINTYLKLTDRQRRNQERINTEAAAPVSKDDPGKQLRLMSMSLNNALSPFLYDRTTPKDYKEFVEQSPKIKYTLQCIRTVKMWHQNKQTDISGQVIYIDRGKDYFPLIKQYLEIELGYKKNVPMLSNPRQRVDQVEIITGGISVAKKEKIKVAFNEGTCKIIIGTSTIKEGINLQKKSTCLYNLYPNWNPTDVRQLEGRIWRQKNENGFVRIVMPLMENSMDVFVFQKLDEKTSRINDLWNRSDRGNVLDKESLDPNEVKFALVTDLGVLTRFEIDQIKRELFSKELALEANIKALSTYSDLQKRYQELYDLLLSALRQTYSRMDSIQIVRSIEFGSLHLNNIDQHLDTLTKTQLGIAERFKKNTNVVREYFVKGTRDDADLIRAYAAKKRIESSYMDYKFDYFKDVVSRFGKIKRTIFERRGYSLDADISKIEKDLQNEIELVKLEVQQVMTEDYYAKVLKSIAQKKKKLNLKGGDLKQRVVDFASLNHLLSYKFYDLDHTVCEIPDKENPNFKPQDRQRRLRLAKAKAKALKIKLQLAS